MLDNHYVYETPDFFDIDQVRQIVMRKLDDGYVLHGYVRINVDNDEYLSSISQRFDFLGNWLNIYYVRPQGNIPLHIDGHRLAAFNIPISGCDETSQTIWYVPSEGDLLKTYKPDERHYRIANTNLVEVYRFALVRPALVRNDVAHDVRRFNATEIRIIASWGCAGTFEECRDRFKEVLGK